MNLVSATLDGIKNKFKNMCIVEALDTGNCIYGLKVNDFEFNLISGTYPLDGRFYTIIIGHVTAAHFQYTEYGDLYDAVDSFTNRKFVTECLVEVLKEPLENVPLYISKNKIVGAVAAWRLKEGV